MLVSFFDAGNAVALHRDVLAVGVEGSGRGAKGCRYAAAGQHRCAVPAGPGPLAAGAGHHVTLVAGSSKTPQLYRSSPEEFILTFIFGHMAQDI